MPLPGGGSCAHCCMTLRCARLMLRCTIEAARLTSGQVLWSGLWRGLNTGKRCQDWDKVGCICRMRQLHRGAEAWLARRRAGIAPLAWRRKSPQLSPSSMGLQQSRCLQGWR